MGDQELRLLLRFNALGDDAQAEVPGHRQHQLDDGGVVDVVRRVVHEALVDLQLVQGEALQVGQAGIAGAEVVDRETNAQRGKLGHAADGFLEVVDEQAFGDFENQLGWRGASVDQHALDLPDEVGLAKLPWADIDGNRQRVALLATARQRQAGLLEHPGPEFEDHARFFRDRHELRRWHKAAQRVAPSHGEFGAGRPNWSTGVCT